MKNIAISWILYSIREAIGLSDVRNEIIRNEVIRNEVIRKKLNGFIYYGDTFTSGNTFSHIYQLIYDFEKSEKTKLIFTANGEVSKNLKKRTRADLVESHYVSFILDKTETLAVIIDPSRNNGKPGIYNPYIGIYLEPFFKSRGYKVKWLEMTSPCQIDYHDVFCQSWTLYLILKYLTSDSIQEPIYIPSDQRKKYGKLLRFFKSLLIVESFRNELIFSYKDNIRNHDDFKLLKKFKPCGTLLDMETEDMNETESEPESESEPEPKPKKLKRVIDLT